MYIGSQYEQTLKKYRAHFARSGLTLCTIGIGTQLTKKELCGCGEECVDCRLCSLTPHTPGKYTTPTGVPFCRLRALTPHTPGKYSTCTGFFLLARLLNPSHSWKVHHTHRGLFSRLCYITPHTLTRKFIGPTGLFCIGYVTCT